MTSILLPLIALAGAELSWPEITQTAKPWSRNWWLGCAVDKENLEREYKAYSECGIGGLDIIPLYEVKNNEARDIRYLSPQFDLAFQYALAAAESNGMGIGMAMGSGWCFGGPQISKERGGWRFETLVFDDSEAQQKLSKIPKEELAATAKADGKTVAMVLRNVGIPMVKRAGNGGHGPMLNPYDPQAMRDFLQPFTDNFLKAPGAKAPRFTFHDSWEYYNVDWSQNFRDDFKRLRGYDLFDELPALAGLGDKDRQVFVMQDLRQTYSDLQVKEVFPQWKKWNQERGILTVNQAHGAPANLLDFYALADIPGTEMFRNGGNNPLVSRFNADFFKGDRDPLVTKFAASAANINGTRLVASEFGTWLAEHFNETLEEVKALADLQFLCGVNHIFYHGICYSPSDVPWPGWLFYASTELNPRNSLWRDWKFVNQYIARCQAMFQSAEPDMDVLLYWPIFDLWADRGRPSPKTAKDAEAVKQGWAFATGKAMQMLGVSNSRHWLGSTAFGALSRTMWEGNIGFDSVSDDLLQKVVAVNGELVASGKTKYRVLLVPPCEYMPHTTLEKIAELSKAGAKVVFAEHLPERVPGAHNRSERQQRLECAKKSLAQTAAVGEAFALLRELGIAAHPDCRLKFLRQRIEGGRQYFISNMSLETFSGSYKLPGAELTAVAFDALTGQSGVLPYELTSSGGKRFQLHLPPAGSIFIRIYDREVKGPEFKWNVPGKTLAQLDGAWRVAFKEGGPVLPKEQLQEKLAPWTASRDPQAEAFAGTAVYSTQISLAQDAEADRLLDLGEVECSARVRIDGKYVGFAYMRPYNVRVPKNLLSKGTHIIEVEVTSTAANRIRDLDKRGVRWRIFKDINFADVFYKGFDASKWPLKPCGLIGPVSLRELD